MKRVKLLTVKETEVMTCNNYVEYYQAGYSFDDVTEVEWSKTIIVGKIPVSVYHIQTGEVAIDTDSGKEVPVYSKDLYAIDHKLKDIISCEFKQEIETLRLRILDLENRNRFLDVVNNQRTKEINDERSKSLWTKIKEHFHQERSSR